MDNRVPVTAQDCIVRGLKGGALKCNGAEECGRNFLPFFLLFLASNTLFQYSSILVVTRSYTNLYLTERLAIAGQSFKMSMHGISTSSRYYKGWYRSLNLAAKLNAALPEGGRNDDAKGWPGLGPVNTIRQNRARQAREAPGDNRSGLIGRDHPAKRSRSQSPSSLPAPPPPSAPHASAGPPPPSSTGPSKPTFPDWVRSNHAKFEHLVGLWYQTGWNPMAVVGPYRLGGFQQDLQRADELESREYHGPSWLIPLGDPEYEQIGRWCQTHQTEFESVIRQWAIEANALNDPGLLMTNDFTRMLAQAGWIQSASVVCKPEHAKIGRIKAMREGMERDYEIARYRKKWPRFFEQCWRDQHNTGPSKRELEEDEKENQRKRKKIEKLEEERRQKKTKVMSVRTVRGTQFHGVPENERAIGSDGKRLPFSIEYADESLNPRRPPEEKGSFGKGGRRGKSRTKTPTPAKKEDPNVLYFEEAYVFDQKRKKQEALEEQARTNALPRSSSAAPRSTANANSTSTIISAPEPTEVILYGFQSERQYAAIGHYETVSRGLICEDYSRHPPPERMRYRSVMDISRAILPRPLTREESRKARNYAGGQCWIKVTFDSGDAADRAIYFSPQDINGHWVFAERYTGVGPKDDVEIPITVGDRAQGLLGAPRHTRSGSQTLSSSFSASLLSHAEGTAREASTLPRSFTTNALPQPKSGAPPLGSSASSSTASSATVTGYPSLPRSMSQPSIADGSSTSVQQTPSMRIAGARRAVLLPAEQALLPQPSWTQRWIAQMPLAGRLNGDIIGNQVPRLDSGGFDWARASFYWKICYWIDTHLKTDLCGLKEE
ncbi:MAG: hypothetical protein M1827_001085 [Pycnora praestabilis]|nr:MAG: hypothetical protein M1827_001085 [Pycnora praestabilis]